MDGDAATIASDFRADPAGFVRILVIDEGLGPARAGALVQRLLEIETYRILALLGLPEAQAMAPRVKHIEDSLTRIAKGMDEGGGLEADHRLLDELTSLAAAMEADTASSGYRFGASRAYDGIVQQRLAVIREHGVEGWPTFADFLARRMAPAMRTCTMLEERQARLSEKLSRSANLLRTRVDVEIERQNRDLLSAMNDRTRLAAAPAADRRRTVGRGHQLLRGGSRVLRLQGRQRRRLAALRSRTRDGRHRAAGGRRRRADRAADPPAQRSRVGGCAARRTVDGEPKKKEAGFSAGPSLGRKRPRRACGERHDPYIDVAAQHDKGEPAKNRRVACFC